MSCASCGETKKKGCNSKNSCYNNGSCGKLPVFDWLANMRLPVGQNIFEYVEVRFKNDRKQYLNNVNSIPLCVGDVVAVESSPGHDVGVVSLTGELVRIQMKKKNIFNRLEDCKKLYRKANQKDIETWGEVQKKENSTMIQSRKIAQSLNLEMKICDVEYQGDGSKAIFYYTAEGRVDFRTLIKEYASAFGVRIEMKQIGYRQEAAKVGGIGSCGRELCCSTWLTDFRSVNTTAARYQQLSINPQKLAGQCGKLKCCLNFELDSYLDALNDFPSIETKIQTEKGIAACMKIDVFKKEMWYAYEEGGITWHKFQVDQIKELIKLNDNNQKTASLEDLEKEVLVEEPKEFIDVISENSLERFEKRNRRRKNTKRKPTNNTNRPEQKNRKPREKNRNNNAGKQRNTDRNKKNNK